MVKTLTHKEDIMDNKKFTRITALENMNEVIKAMNNEEGLEKWLYFIPEETTFNDFYAIAINMNDFNEIEMIFEEIYKRYHSDGLYTRDERTVKKAHKYDKSYGLTKIKNMF